MPIAIGGAAQGTPLSATPISTPVGSGSSTTGPGVLPTRFFPSAGDFGGTQTTVERRSLTFAATHDFRAIIYGRVKVGGALMGVANNASSGLLSVGVAIGEGPIHAVEDTSAYGGTGAPWISYDTHLGTASPSSDSSWSSALQGAPETYPFLAWSELTYSTTLLSGSVEFPQFIVQGLPMWDPRENRLLHSEDYSSTYWTFSGTTPTVTTQPGLSQNGTTSANDYAGRWVFGASGSNSAARSTTGLGLLTTDSLTVSCDLRVTSGTATVTLDAIKVTGTETASTSCGLTTTWKRFSATVAAGGSGTGEGRIQIRSIASSGTIEIGRVQVEKNPGPYGYRRTVVSVVTPIEEYGANPALEMADLKTNTRYGQRVGVRATISGSGTDDLRVFWDKSSTPTQGTFEVTIDGTGSPNTYKWRFKPWGGSFGSYTTGVSITTNQQTLSNGVKIRFQSLTGHTNADTWTITTPTDLVDWQSVGLAAEYCDDVMSNGSHRFECHVAIKDRARFSQWETTIGGHFGGAWQLYNGQWKLVVHKPTATITAAVTASQIIPRTVKLSRQSGAGAVDMPNQLSVQWIDPTDDWKQKTLTVTNVNDDLSEIREGAPVPLLGCQTQDQASRSAAYYFNGMLADLRIDFDGLLSLAYLLPGDRITVQYDPVGLTGATDFTVESIKRDDKSLRVSIGAILYSASIWSDVVGATDTIGTFVSVNPFTTPPEPRELKTFSTNYPLRIQWDKPVAFATDSLYGTGSWANSGNTSYDGTKVNDGSTASTAFVTPSGASSYVRLDAGSAKTIGAFRVDISAYTGAFSVGSVASQFGVSYSDDDASYTPVTPRISLEVNSSGTYTGLYIDWNHTSFGSHRYWKLTLNSGGAVMTVTVTEVQPKEVQADEFPYVKGYEILLGVESDSPVVMFVPSTSTPTSTNPLDITSIAAASTVLGSIVYTFSGIVRTVGYNGSKSTGRLISVGASAAADAATQTRPVLRSTTAQTKQVGGIAFDGTAEIGYLDVSGTATGTNPIKVNAPSGLSTNLVDLQVNGTSKAKIASTGDLLTSQSGLVAPALDNQDTSSSDTAITSATVTDITNASKTLVFNTAVRIEVTATWVVTCSAYDLDTSGGNSSFRGILSIGGSDETAEARWIPPAASKQTTITRTWVKDVAAGSCVIKMRGRVNSAGVNEFSVKQPHTGFSVKVVGRF